MLNEISSAGPAQTGAASALPPHQSASPSGFIDFATLAPRVPLCERALRDAIRRGHIPSIVLPGARKRLFWWPAVEAALRRFQQ
jgi:hypothetical protein